MQNKSKGLIFFSKNVKDNDLYIKILSLNDEVISGIVYGGNSSKKKLIYQNGYFIDFSISKKNENSVPIIIGDISEPFIGSIFDDKYKLYALLSILSLINLSILEGQHIKDFYNIVYNLIYKITLQKHWIIFYCEWLFDLLKLIGYQVDYKKNIDKNFFNISEQKFLLINDNNSIEFPHYFFLNRREFTLKNINLIFIIFESIFSKNHLENINYKMPMHFLNFKKIILNRMKN